MQLKHCHFFSVCDGHGTYGRDVSSFLKAKLPVHVENNVRKNLEGHDLATYPGLKQVKSAIKSSFEQTNIEVFAMSADVRFSGSTCVSVMTYGRKLFIANVGDSRAIIIKADPNSKDCK